MAKHHLKINKEYWEPTVTGDMSFTVRRDDRGFQKGDIVVFYKYDSSPANGGFSSLDGRYVHDNDVYSYRSKDPKDADMFEARITYVLTGGQYGIEPGYVVIGLKPCQSE